MQIRIATPSDILAMFEVRTRVLENHMSMEELAAIGVTPDTLASMLDGEGRGWVAEEDSSILAFAMADAAEATVFAMFVRPGSDDRGLGRRLMDEAEQWLFSHGCEEIWLVTDSRRSVRANGFYRHLGWVDDGIQEDGQVRFVKRSASVSTKADRRASS
ncbi:GNAT family N-acetyltransferase [Polaromonas sp. SM01]|uniref:GNAT family N-acetyltransferase n=1 Tax=Polaromonas sp. SM01 TaxID=3085630 RepID=UPI002980B07E|nr:GNAT family N-acetyltransferase [Polaromonas sp. SM01]MDW5443278.1 GNAT family N-acetyltransferase [Polaromonas sp. SM01]